jgi:S1-C subfamily serine protease
VIGDGDLSGSGWVYGAKDGRPLVVTNQHVVDEHEELSVSSEDGEPTGASIYASSLCDDLALLQLDEPATLRSLSLGPLPRVRDSILVVGFPVTPADTAAMQFKDGTVSAVHATIQRQDRDLTAVYRDLLQVNASIEPGNSAGRSSSSTPGKLLGSPPSRRPPSPRSASLSARIGRDRFSRICRRACPFPAWS